VTASFTEKKRRELAEMLEPYREGALDSHPWKDWAEWDGHAEGAARKPGATSRWSRDKDLSWEPLRVELVCEVAYDHMQGSRFRHTAQFRRWRADKRPADCRFDQLEVTPPEELEKLFARPA
jgi:ATP-dependent DNA ligase